MNYHRAEKMTTEHEPLPLASLSDMSDAQRLELLVGAVTDYAIYMLSPGGHISSWNAGAQRFKGYTAAEAIGKHFSMFYGKEDREAGIPEKALRTALLEGRFEDEGWRVRKDGSRFRASVVIDRILDHAGRLVGYAKITRDITERWIAMQALRESERQFRLLVQGVTDYAIYMLSPTGSVASWNAGAQHIKGYLAQEIIGSNFSRFYTENDRKAGLPARALETARRTGHFEGEGWRLRKDGSRFWAQVVIDAIYDDDGTLAGFAKITRDITEKRQTAAALEQANAALYQSQKMEAIGKLTGGVAHDFNNLLAVIVSGLDLLAMQAPQAGTARVLDSMQRAASRGASLTQQLLAFARKQPLQPGTHDVNQLIRDFDIVLRRAIEPGGAALELRLAPDLRPALIDDARFESALLNLVVNARDAMPAGGTITITTENLLPDMPRPPGGTPGEMIRVTITDTGAGMSADVAQRAFDPFFTTKEVGAGSGLGLSQVYGFVRQSGGDVVIDSTPGKGTTISLYLPAAPALAEAAPAVQPQEGSAERRTAGKKALLVDDEPDVLLVAVELFRNMGYEVLSAGNAKDALRILDCEPDIDVLFSDVVMPGGISGLDLASQVRRVSPHTRILLASGYPVPTLQAEHGALSQFTLLSKPYRLTELTQKLQALG
jgi:PAS domain S-box-containing protein